MRRRIGSCARWCRGLQTYRSTSFSRSAILRNGIDSVHWFSSLTYLFACFLSQFGTHARWWQVSISNSIPNNNHNSLFFCRTIYEVDKASMSGYVYSSCYSYIEINSWWDMSSHRWLECTLDWPPQVVFITRELSSFANWVSYAQSSCGGMQENIKSSAWFLHITRGRRPSIVTHLFRSAVPHSWCFPKALGKSS